MSSTARRRLWVTAFLVSSGASALFAGSSSRREAPHDWINPVLDGNPVVVENTTDGSALAAWSFRSGGEFDIAVSTRDRDGIWSQPTFIGRFDGADQRSPALTLDSVGNAYLAFSSSDSRRVLLTFRPAGISTWSSPMPVSPAGAVAVSPALLIVGDRLVVAFRAGGRTAMVQFALPGANSNRPNGVTDTPDPFGGHGPPVGDSPGGSGTVLPPGKKK